MISSICGTPAPGSTAPTGAPLPGRAGGNASPPSAFLRALADFFFPPLCLICKEPIATYAEHFLCPRCAADIVFIDSPLCPVCGIMYFSREGGDHVCGNCLSSPPCFDLARSAVVYAGTLKAAIHAFKYRGGLLFAKPLGKLLAERGRRVLELGPADVAVSVPLHRTRLRERGFNQSLELARCVGAAWGIPVITEGLLRTRHTPHQTNLSRRERSRNVRGAFAWKGRGIEGVRVLLIDDVYTSGATAHECAAELKRAGAASVAVLTLARAL